MLSPTQIATNIILTQQANAYYINLAVKYQLNGLDKKYDTEMAKVARIQNILYVLSLDNINDCLDDNAQIRLWSILHGLIQECPTNIDMNYILWQDLGDPIMWQS